MTDIDLEQSREKELELIDWGIFPAIDSPFQMFDSENKQQRVVSVNKDAFPNNLLLLLKRYGKTQAEFARQIGLSTVAVNAWVSKDEKKQPNWLLPLAKTIEFFLKAGDDFSPMHLFDLQWHDEYMEKERLEQYAYLVNAFHELEKSRRSEIKQILAEFNSKFLELKDANNNAWDEQMLGERKKKEADRFLWQYQENKRIMNNLRIENDKLKEENNFLKNELSKKNLK